MNYPLPPNPLRDLRSKLSNLTELPSIKKYKPVTSKCGLGKTQGTKGQARGISFDSYWEFAFYIYITEIENRTCTRNTTKSFEYFDESGNKAKFYPDFIVDGCFYEVKGIYRPNDILKKDYCTGLVTFLGPEEMKPIVKAVYKYRPNWKDEYIEVAKQIKYGQTNS